MFYLLVFITLCTYQSNAVPRFANYLQDYMVLQRAIVWGFGESNTLTTLTIDGRTYTTISETSTNAQNESIWSVTLDPVSDEGPFDIHVTQPSSSNGNVTITLHDVLFGDVWLCSGQSNMQLTVNMIYNATEEIANAGNYPKIRVFTAALMTSSVPIEELLGIDLDWSVASAHSIGGPDWTHMSAVCWLYSRMIHQALNARPIGLIATSWGGTVIEYWMPPKALEDCDIPPNISNYAPSYSDSIQAPVLNHSNLFNSMIHPFTRMVSYGSAWYQGENNVGYNRDKHACSFSKLIFYWRQIWFNRTNGLTHIEFPFGFVQL